MARPRHFDTDAVLGKAAGLFWAGGFEAVSVQDLCGAMGIAPASLYGAFGDKRALFVAALDHYMRGSQANFAGWIGEARGAAGLHAFFDRLLDRLTGRVGGQGCLVTNTAAEMAAHDPEVARMVELHLARLQATFGALLAEARAAGDLRPGAGPDSAAMLVCVAQGLNVIARTRPRREQLQQIVASALNALISPA